MRGTLIVGTPSKPGETVKMGHHTPGAKAASQSSGDKKGQVAADAIAATGKINSIDAGKGSINITHDPIKALSWPKMKMEFSVAKGVDLSGLKAGDAVTFSLKPQGEDDFIVVKINKAN